MTKVYSFKNYQTRDLIASKPTVKVPIYILGVGVLPEQSLSVLSTYDNEYRQSESEYWADIAEVNFGDLKDDARADALQRLRCKQMAKLVQGWTFEEECNLENVTEFLYQNPNMFDIVNTAAAKDASFFGERSTDSKEESDS